VQQLRQVADCFLLPHLHFELAKLYHTLLSNELNDVVRVLRDQLLHSHCRQLRCRYLYIIPRSCGSESIATMCSSIHSSSRGSIK
jgi:hypothetical protein